MNTILGGVSINMIDIILSVVGMFFLVGLLLLSSRIGRDDRFDRFETERGDKFWSSRYDYPFQL